MRFVLGCSQSLDQDSKTGQGFTALDTTCVVLDTIGIRDTIVEVMNTVAVGEHHRRDGDTFDKPGGCELVGHFLMPNGTTSP